MVVVVVGTAAGTVRGTASYCNGCGCGSEPSMQQWPSSSPPRQTWNGPPCYQQQLPANKYHWPLATFALMKTSNIQQGRHKQEDKFSSLLLLQQLLLQNRELHRMGQANSRTRQTTKERQRQDEIIKAICRLD